MQRSGGAAGAARGEQQLVPFVQVDALFQDHVNRKGQCWRRFASAETRQIGASQDASPVVLLEQGVCDESSFRSSDCRECVHSFMLDVGFAAASMNGRMHPFSGADSVPRFDFRCGAVSLRASRKPKKKRGTGRGRRS